jgi:apolipoprotein N-acyltransferase
MRFVHEINIPIFTGFPHSEIVMKYKGQDSPVLSYNTASIFKPKDRNSLSEKTAPLYHKNILVPFGERIPFLNVFQILWKLQFGQANFEKGLQTRIYDITNQIAPKSRSYKFAPLICFEIAFPYFTKKITAANQLDFFVNITNDAWFHRSIGTSQHAQMAAYRSIETRKPVFRCANTGYTFYTKPSGKIMNKTKLFDKIAISGNLYLLENNKENSLFFTIGNSIIYILFIIFSLQIIQTFFICFVKNVR